MKTRWMLLKKYLPWMLIMLIMDSFFCILLWLADVQAFLVLSVIIFLASLILFFLIFVVTMSRELRYQNTFKKYIDSPTELNEKELLALISGADKDIIQLIGKTLKEKHYQYAQLQTRVSDYEEYVESWVHEMKTPISLLTILLDNHRDELPKNILFKMDYIRNCIQEYVDQMLFYARLKGDKKDYFFENINLSKCIDDILEDYEPLIEEKKFIIKKEALNTDVFSDKRGLRFILSQIISNSVKYTQKENIPELEIFFKTMEYNNALIIKDNGCGVQACDLPYIFEKGFTGDSGEKRKKATGIGLYLAKELADDLKLELEAESEWMQGFEIRIILPKVE